MRIAVIGSGISGLSAAYLLSRRHEVTLFEAGERLGGHSNTVQVEAGTGQLAIDTGFIVCNAVNYPNFYKLMAELGVALVPEASFHGFNQLGPWVGHTTTSTCHKQG